MFFVAMDKTDPAEPGKIADGGRPEPSGAYAALLIGRSYDPDDSKAVGAWLKCAKLQVESTLKLQRRPHFLINSSLL